MQHSASTVGLNTAIGTAVQQMPKSYVQSRTIVMETAFCLLQQGLLNIPDIGGVNVEQARALLCNAAWLQEHMNRVWSAEAMPGGSPACHGRPTDTDAFEQFDLLIIGPGGTGKTAVLKITEALTTYFAGPNVVQKLAPSNAAARLLGGDTIHAMLKLPFGKATLTSKKGRLTKGTLSIHKRKWASSIAAYLDEISMVSADQFLHMDVRMRQATNMKTVPFGGLAMNLCGDFLQLPPVDKYGTRKSLAKPVDDAGFLEPESADEDIAGDGKKG